MKLIVFIFLVLANCSDRTVKELLEPKISADTQLRLTTAPWDHSPYYLLDGNTKTSWCSEGEGIDTAIHLKLSGLIEVDAIQFVNGLARSLEVSNNNPQIAKLEISSRKSETDRLQKQGLLELQKVKFSEKKEPIKTLIKLEKRIVGRDFDFTIREIHSGKLSKNLCMTSLELGKLDKDGKFEAYPLNPKTFISDKIKDLEKAKSHNVVFAAIKFLSSNPLLLCSFKGCMNLKLTEDGIFKLSYTEIHAGTKEDGTEVVPSVTDISGSYDIDNFSGEGIELKLKYNLSTGGEIQEAWVLKRVKKEDVEFDKFKTLLGENFSNYDGKKNFLISLVKKGNPDEIFFNYTIPFEYKSAEQPKENQ